MQFMVTIQIPVTAGSEIQAKDKVTRSPVPWQSITDVTYIPAEGDIVTVLSPNLVSHRYDYERQGVQYGVTYKVEAAGSLPGDITRLQPDVLVYLTQPDVLVWTHDLWPVPVESHFSQPSDVPTAAEVGD